MSNTTQRILLIICILIFLYLIRDALVNVVDIFREYPLGFIIAVLIIFIFGKSMDIDEIDWSWGV